MIQFSKRAQQMNSSAIREILKVTEDPRVISFAGGIPAPQTFPVDEMRAGCDRLFAQDPQGSLQYAATEGYGPLRQWIAKKHQVGIDQVLITTGSQQGLDLIAKIFIDNGSPVLVESPTYLGALQAFSVFEPRFVAMACDDISLDPAQLTASMLDSARLAYIMPNFQNPTGKCLPLERRRALVEKFRNANALIIEDDPYGELIFSGEPEPTLFSLYQEGVIHLGSFSKILAPGLRLGYMVARADIISKLVQAKQASDLHTSSFAQRLAYEVVKGDFLPGHVESIRALYSSQCDVMLEALAEHMPETVSWTHPQGGMFIWAKLPAGIDTGELLQLALKEAMEPKVAFVPGAPFFADAPQRNTLRLSFATVPPARIREGIAQLAKLVKAQQ